MASLRDSACGKITSQMFAAVQKLQQSGNGPLTDICQLKDYFDPPPDDAILHHRVVLPAIDAYAAANNGTKPER